MRFFYSYIPYAISFVLGIALLNHISMIALGVLWMINIGMLVLSKKNAMKMLGLLASFQLGIGLHFYEESSYAKKQNAIAPFLNQKVTLEGKIVSHPVPSKGGYRYILKTEKISEKSMQFRIQLISKTYQSPQKNDRVKLATTLYVPSPPNKIQEIRDIQAYGVIHGDRQWTLIEPANSKSTQIREHIFEKAKTYLSPTSYGYYRAMVFGDQSFLSPNTIIRLKETGLLHLFVISGSHITYVWLIGFCIFRIFLSGFGIFHRNKSFFLWIELGSILSVVLFLTLINSPISTYRAVGSMLLFLLLRLFRRYQHPLWNLGVVYVCTLLMQPLFLFDISTQLTFGSVAGILGSWTILNHYTNLSENSWVAQKLIQTVCITVGASFFTLPILYLQLGVFYPSSLIYNLLFATTIGSLVSVVSVLSFVWTALPWDLINQWMFYFLDQLFLLFEKILLWKLESLVQILDNHVPHGLDDWFWALCGGVCVVGTIIAQQLSKRKAQ